MDIPPHDRRVVLLCSLLGNWNVGERISMETIFLFLNVLLFYRIKKAIDGATKDGRRVLKIFLYFGYAFLVFYFVILVKG